MFTTFRLDKFYSRHTQRNDGLQVLYSWIVHSHQFNGEKLNKMELAEISADIEINKLGDQLVNKIITLALWVVEYY